MDNNQQPFENKGARPKTTVAIALPGEGNPPVPSTSRRAPVASTAVMKKFVVSVQDNSGDGDISWGQELSEQLLASLGLQIQGGTAPGATPNPFTITVVTQNVPSPVYASANSTFAQLAPVVLPSVIDAGDEQENPYTELKHDDNEKDTFESYFQKAEIPAKRWDDDDDGSEGREEFHVDPIEVKDVVGVDLFLGDCTLLDQTLGRKLI